MKDTLHYRLNNTLHELSRRAIVMRLNIILSYTININTKYHA